MAEGGELCLYNCVVCGQESRTEAEMRTHILLQHVEGSICCPFCDLQGATVQEIEDHLYKEHLELLSPGKKLNSAASGLAEDQEEETARPKTSSFKKGKKAPYVNLEYFNKSLVEMTESGDRLSSTEASSSRGGRCEVSVIHVRSGSELGQSSEHTAAGRSSNTIMDVVSSSESVEQMLITNKEMGAKMYQVPVHHLPSNSLEFSLPQAGILASKRARLSLDVSPCGSKNNTQKHSGGSSTSSGSEFHCPLCKFTTSSESDIQRHVNILHLDVLSPAKPGISADCASSTRVETDLDSDQYMEIVPEDEPMPSTSQVMFECPICGMHLDSSLSLELHVNSKHLDVLSPDVTSADSDTIRAEATTTVSMEKEKFCPVCGMQFSDPLSMTTHVEEHFNSEHTQDKLIAREMMASERAGQLADDAALAADLANSELLDEIMAKELAQKEQASELREKEEFEELQAEYGMDSKNSYKKQYELSLERAVYKGQITVDEFHNHKAALFHTGVNGIDDGHSCTKGILARMCDFYERLPVSVSSVRLCSFVDHYAASHGDKGWGCGYRNFQMILSSLATHDIYQKVLFNGRPLIPSIPKIQRLIETAWQKGFDVQGAEQLGGKLVNTSKWIGATEITATLLSLSVQCRLVDFHAPSGPGGTHPKLLSWVRDFYQTADQYRPPLYLQHQGHSRTVIGVEELKDGNLRLLLFDPSCSKKQMERFQGEITGSQLRILRRTVQSLKAKQYQIVAVEGVLDDREYEDSFKDPMIISLGWVTAQASDLAET